MPRKIVPHRPLDPYHITARCHNREPFHIAINDTWRVMEDYLYLIKLQFNVEIHSFVLMSNHFHLLMTSAHENMGTVLQYFMRETSRQINRLSGRTNQTYGRRNYKTYIGNPHYFQNTYKYVYQNPVRARICQRVEEYPFSTLHGLCGFSRLTIPVVTDTYLFNPGFDEKTLQWLNTPVLQEHEDEIRLALKKAQFNLATDRKTGRPSELETALI